MSAGVGLLCACTQARSSHPGDAGQAPIEMSDAASLAETRDAQRIACAELAEAVCADRDRCDEARDPTTPSPDEQCLIIEAANCEVIYDLPGVSGGTAGALSRAKAVREHDCSSYEHWELGDWRGTLEAGASCVRDEQCATGACVNGPDRCGTCKETSAEQEVDQPCGDLEQGRLKCRGDLLCLLNASRVGVCQERMTLGSPCGALGRGSCLARELVCVDGVCLSAALATEPCDPLHDSCFANGFCDKESLSCRRWDYPPLPIGSRCGGIPGPIPCGSDELYCELPADAPSGFYDGYGTCRQRGTLHEPCGACLGNLVCLDGMCEPIVRSLQARLDRYGCGH